MKLNIKTVKGEKIQLEIPETTTIQEIKSQIQS